MPVSLANFVQENCNNPGTAAVWNLGGAPSGYISFVAGIGNAGICYALATDGAQSMWGRVQVTAGSPNTLTWLDVIGNSAGGTSRLNFTGPVQVYNETPAERALQRDEAGLVAVQVPTPALTDNSSAAASTAFVRNQFNNRLFGSNGYQALPNGLVLQWGQGATAGSGGGAAVVFPVAFVTACVAMTATVIGGGPSAVSLTVGTPTPTTNALWAADGAGAPAAGVAFFWQAIGY